jgi:FeS assembly SUF system protein
MESKPGRVSLPLDTPEPRTPAPAPTAPATSAQADGPVDVEALKEKVIGVLRTCYDPEIPVNIHELGLVYDVLVQENGAVHIRMTLTSPACPVAGSLPPEIQNKIEAIPEVSSARVEIVWDPPWTPERMSEAARLELGFF